MPSSQLPTPAPVLGNVSISIPQNLPSEDGSREVRVSVYQRALLVSYASICSKHSLRDRLNAFCSD
jgi:hypothetical protein